MEVSGSQTCALPLRWNDKPVPEAPCQQVGHLPIGVALQEKTQPGHVHRRWARGQRLGCAKGVASLGGASPSQPVSLCGSRWLGVPRRSLCTHADICSPLPTCIRPSRRASILACCSSRLWRSWGRVRASGSWPGAVPPPWLWPRLGGPGALSCACGPLLPLNYH